MIRAALVSFLLDEDGVTATEYAMMLVLIIVAVISAISAVGNSVAGGWTSNVTKIQSASAAASGGS
jgi:Flp pilus assembly pilin Flp